MAARKNNFPSSPVEQFFSRLQPYQREIAGSILLVFTVITLLSLFSLTEGRLSQWWADLFTQLFGWWAVPATILLGLWGGLLTFGRLRQEDYLLPFDIVIGVELLFVVGLTLTHLLAIDPGDYAVKLAREGGGGGFVGWGVSHFLVDLLGASITIFFLMMIGLAAVGLTFRLSLTEATEWRGLFNRWSQHRPEQQPEEEIIPVEAEDLAEPPATIRKPRHGKESVPRPALTPAPPGPAETAAAVMPPSKRALPPLSLLATPAKDPARGANTRYQAQIIEETLQGFGIPGEVVEINSGPTVTQFGLKLGTLERKLPDGVTAQQRIRVSKVIALNNDLALALSASPIRIEAPVPGRPLVGIEVPNTDKTMVSLRGVIEDASFQKSKKPLLVALGKNVSGHAISASLSEMPHMLIAGSTGSGKSVCINALITTLLVTHAPEQLRFLMIDPKMVELIGYNGIPHLIAPVITDFEQVVGALAWATREMERRYKLFASAKARSISSYNQKVDIQDRLPYLVVVIDELADLMMMAPDEVERHICRIAQMARATGIHLVIATQRPSVDVVTGLIKANFPTRIAFAVTSQIDSRVILDTPGADKLLGRGDMLYMASDSPKLIRLQGCFVSDTEIQNIVNFWRNSQGTPALQMTASAGGEAELPWADIVAEAERDEMLEEAIKLITESGRASTSMLQRRLGIGYPRASRLMDQLEAEGIIGPAEGSKPREVLGSGADDYDEFDHDVRG